RPAAGLHRRPGAGARDHRPRGRRRADAAGLPSQRRGARRIDQLPVEDGRAPRARRSQVRRLQRSARVRAAYVVSGFSRTVTVRLKADTTSVILADTTSVILADTTSVILEDSCSAIAA